MLALYRKYRPKTFDEILGQSVITETLKNQIITGDVAHAYLFLGTRGTGKTSAAKIMSRAVNCENPIAGNPCNKCKSCMGIVEEKILDVIEMDAASNNSVDDIRELKDKAAYPPSFTKKKVYIIDEVHMLSKGAFNALLKILEEPPEHILFILATTEPQKIPATIISRTQRFQFNRIQDKDICTELSKVLSEEGYEYDNKALSLIADHSDGSMRDALSILDQTINSHEDVLTEEIVRSTLGLTENQVFERIIDGAINQDSMLVLEQVDMVYRKGGNIPRFIESLLGHFRDLLLLKSTNVVPKNLSSSEEKAILEQVKFLSFDFLFKGIEILNSALFNLRFTEDSRLLCEVTLLKLIQFPNLPEEVQSASNTEKLNNKSTKPVVNQNINRSIETVEQVNKTHEVKAKETLNKGLEDDIIKNEKSLDMSDRDQLWERFQNVIRSKKPSTYALLKEASLHSFDSSQIVLAFKEGYTFHKRTIENQNNRGIILEAAKEVFGPITDFKTIISEEKDDKVDRLIETFGKDIVEIIED